MGQSNVGGASSVSVSGEVMVGGVNVTNFPTNYPDSDALTQLENILGEVGDNNTQLADLVTANGHDATGISPPTGGSGILGWLSGAYDKLYSIAAYAVDQYNQLLAINSTTGSISSTTGAISSTAGDISAKMDTALTDLGQLHTDNGTGGTGITQPAGGSGILGFLSGIYQKATTIASGIGSRTWNLSSGSDSVTVTGTVTSSLPSNYALETGGNLASLATHQTDGTAKTELYDGTNVIGTAAHPVKTDPTGTTTQPVSGTVTANAGTNLNTSALALETGGNLATAATALGHLTDGTQTTRITDGTQTANTIAGDTGQNSLLSAPATKIVTYTTSGAADTVIDCLNYRWGCIQLSSIGSTINLVLQGSNDNANWQSIPYTPLNTSAPVSSIGALTSAGQNKFEIPTRYIRLHVTAQTGAAPSATVVLYASSPTAGISPFNTVAATQNGTWTVQPGNTQNTTPWYTEERMNYTHINSNGTTVVKNSAGILHGIHINTKGSSSNTLTIYDNTAGSGTVVGIMDTTSSVQFLDMAAIMTTGITIVTATGTAADLTVTWR